MNWIREKTRNAYLKAKERRERGEKGGMEITTVVGLVIVAIVVLVLVKNMFVNTTHKATNSTEKSIDTLYDDTKPSSVDTTK
jgi:flagellar basal body-associated protein FliL